MAIVQSRLLDHNKLLIKSISYWRACVTQSTLCSGTQRQVSVTTEGATRNATLSQVYVTGLACGASDVKGLCHRFGMWWVRCQRFMSKVWHVVRQMSQVYATGLACGASDVKGLCHRFGMWCVRCHRFMPKVWHVVRQMSQDWHVVRQMSQVWHVVRQMSQVYATGLACGASDVTGLCHRFGMWCVRFHRFMSQVWHVVRQISQVYVTGLACGASDVTGLCHRFGMWCVRCHRFGMWCVRCNRFGMWCVRCNRFGMCHGVCASDVMASVRQMSCHVMLKLLLQTFVVWRLWSSVYKNFSWKISRILTSGQNV